MCGEGGGGYCGGVADFNMGGILCVRHSPYARCKSRARLVPPSPLSRPRDCYCPVPPPPSLLLFLSRVSPLRWSVCDAPRLLYMPSPFSDVIQCSNSQTAGGAAVASAAFFMRHASLPFSGRRHKQNDCTPAGWLGHLLAMAPLLADTARSALELALLQGRRGGGGGGGGMVCLTCFAAGPRRGGGAWFA